MPEAITTERRDEIDIAALLNQYVYSDDQRSGYIDSTLAEIFRHAEELDYRLAENETVKNALANTEGLGERIRLISQSTEVNADMKLVIACAFLDEETGTVYIAYRGTGDGKWVDNGDAFSKEASVMQEAAREYFDHVIEMLPEDSRIVVTGHSKGGNLAQYVTMASEYGDRVEFCYSMDGQGFSKEAILAFRERWGDRYEEQIGKMYSINGINDYVHVLGNRIIPEERTYYIRTTLPDNFTGWHDLRGFFNGNGSVNWSYLDSEKQVIDVSVPQGPVGRLAKELSEKLMAMDPERLDACAVTIMTMLELFMNDGMAWEDAYLQGTGDRPGATSEEIGMFLETGVPVLIDTLILSENTPEIIELMGLDPMYVTIVNEIRQYAIDHGITSMTKYLSEDPYRLFTMISEMDLSRKEVLEALAELLSPQNLIAFAAQNPKTAAVITAILANPVMRGMITSLAELIVVAGLCAMTIQHILYHWDEFCAMLAAAAEYIAEELRKLCDMIHDAAVTTVNYWTASVLLGLETIVTVGSGILEEAAYAAQDLLEVLKDTVTTLLNAAAFISNPILYTVAAKLRQAFCTPVTVDLSTLGDCVGEMYSLAGRVSAMDARLDSLYFRLAQDNIEQEEGIFTSLAKMYHLVRADFQVDGGRAIRRRAEDLDDLYGMFCETERWIAENAPHF